MGQSDENTKQFQIETTKITQEAILKYKENESNKIIQIFHVTTAVIIALLAFTKGSLLSGLCLLAALAFMFIAYGCFCFSDFNFATVNVLSMLNAFAKVYGVDGLNEADKIEFSIRSIKAKGFRYGYIIALILAFLSILLALAFSIMQKYCVCIMSSQ